MVASEHTSQSPAPARRVAEHGRRASSEGSHDTAAAQVHQLLDRAGQLHLRAPELARVLGQRAAVLAESAGTNTLWIHAEALVVLTTIRLGHRAGTVGRAVAVLRAAEDAGEDVLAVRLRTALAVCARSAGVPLTGLAVLRPALSGAGVPGVHRAAALSQLAGCVTGLAGKAELDKVFAQADRLCSEDGTLTGDAKLEQGALLRMGMSAHRRRHGDLVGAADAARTGIGLLDGLEDAVVDGGVARSRLTLELVTSLLDRGETGVAFDVAGPILARPPRSAEIAPVGWLRFAIATRVHLAAGAGHAATRLLRDALHDTDRHSMWALSARLRSELAHVEERMGRPADALEILRDARADERAHARLRGRAYAVLTSEFGAGERPRLDFTEILGQPTPAATETQTAEVEKPAPVRTSAAAGEPAAGPASRAQSPAHHAAAAGVGTAAAGAGAAAGGGAEAAGAPRAEQAGSGSGSVLDRLGITGGGGGSSTGGRRRAVEASASETTTFEAPAVATTAEATTAEATTAGTATPETTTPETTGAEATAAETAESAGAAPEASEAGATTAEATTRSDDPGSEQVDWLPRLKLPPSLAPIDELLSAVSDPSSRDEALVEHRDSGDETGSRAGTPLGDDSVSLGHEVSGDEPPADAGLAELLTRALAEHQAGTTSASALVKRLGTGDEGADTPRVNGRHRGDD